MDVWDFRKTKKQDRCSTVFGCQDELVVLVVPAREGGQIKSRVGAFPEFFSMADSRPEICRAGVS